MKMRSTLVAILAAAALAAAAPARAALNVIAATEDLASIAREVGGDKIKADEFLFQFQFSIGAHGAHTF